MASEDKQFKWDEEDKKAAPSAGFTWDTAEPAPPPRTEQRLTQAEVDAANPKTQFEKSIPGHGITTEGMGTSALGALKKVGSGILDTLNPTTSTLFHPSEMPIVKAAHEARAGWNRPTDVRAKIGEAVTSGLGSLVGMSGESAAQHAAKGEGGAILGEAAVPAVMAAAPLALEGTKVLRGKVGEGIHTAEGELKPMAKTVGQVGGGLAGAAYGLKELNPYAAVTGGAAGYKLGPSLMEKMFPAPAPKPIFPGAAFPDVGEFYTNKGTEMNAVRRQTEQSARQAAREAKANAPEPPEPELGSLENPGFHSKIPTRMPKPAPVEVPTPELGTPENPGWHSKIPTRMPPSAETLVPEPPLGSPENPGWHSKVPNRMPRTGASAVAPEPAVGEGPALPKAQVVKLPVPHEPLPGENPGFMASIPRGRLLDLGRQGRSGAGQQLQNIGKSVLYVPEEYPGPRQPAIEAAPEASLQHVGVKPVTEYRPSEKAGVMSGKRKDLGPEFESGEQAHEIERNKSILRNPKATPEDRRIAQTRLDEMEEPSVSLMGAPSKLASQRFMRNRASQIREARY